ncbi:hypothetical protein KY289_001307 [Solanum tuberosum]|nr:hypothetical protein KY289_001307 [Solanum tuberosum]
MRCVQDDNQVEKYQIEKNLKTQLEKWVNIEENATEHKARVLWLNEDACGTVIQDAKGIQREIDNKAPGGDAFDALFYKKTLPLMGKEITQAVLHFFDTGVMCEAINCALITLI